jgi:hypothetical protein
MSTAETTVDQTIPAPPPQAMTVFSGVQRTSFADRNAATTDKMPTYKGKTGNTDRICLVSSDVLAVARVHNHFIEGHPEQSLGYVLCKSTYKRNGDMEVPDKIGVCCQYLPEATKRCVTFVIRYSADKNGKPTKPVEYTTLAWVFGPSKFEDLRAIQEEGYDLNKTDLIVTCEDDKFQKLKFIPSPTCVRDLPEFRQRFDESIKQWLDAATGKMERVLGRSMPDAEIIQKARGAAGLAPAGGGTGAPVGVQQQAVPSDIEGLFA